MKASKATPRAAPRDALIASLSRTIDDTLARVLGGAKSCAMVVLYPNDVNVGDNAIWLGQRAYLKAKRVEVSHLCDNRTYEPEKLRAALHRHPGPILIQGGGDLGDVYPELQRFRERVITAFGDTPIVQLPQSIHFQNRDSLERARKVFDSHPNLVLLTRDQASLNIARREFQVASDLCPDMAFALGPLNRPDPRGGHLLWLSREDVESVYESPRDVDQTVEVVDWRKLPHPTLREPLALVASSMYKLRKTDRRIPRPLRALMGKAMPWSFDTMARRRLTRGLEMIASGEVVITDRLHGHILSVLMGIPHVLLDNNYGKVTSFHETWTKEFEDCSVVTSSKEAWERAQEMLRMHAPENRA